MAKRIGPSKERQEQIARELGLLPPLSTTPSEYKVHRGMAPYPEIMRKADPPPAPAPPPCPCADLPFGNHKMLDGWCVDGAFYTHGDLNSIKRVQVVAGKDRLAPMIDRLRAIHAIIPLDFTTLNVQEDVR